jgi:hypothetical protein
MRRIAVKATMDSDAWRPFDPVDVKRRVGPDRRRDNNRQVFLEPSPDEDGYTWLTVSVVTFITLTMDAEA